MSVCCLKVELYVYRLWNFRTAIERD